MIIMWVYNITLGFNGVPYMKAIDIPNSPPLIASLMYGLVGIGATTCGNYL
jgi:hypothetical protein